MGHCLLLNRTNKLMGKLQQLPNTGQAARWILLVRQPQRVEYFAELVVFAPADATGSVKQLAFQSLGLRWEAASTPSRCAGY